jgi:hypothetical protein
MQTKHYAGRFALVVAIFRATLHFNTRCFDFQIMEQKQERENEACFVTSQSKRDKHTDVSARIRVLLNAKITWSRQDVHTYDDYDENPVIRDGDVNPETSNEDDTCVNPLYQPSTLNTAPHRFPRPIYPPLLPTRNLTTDAELDGRLKVGLHQL